MLDGRLEASRLREPRAPGVPVDELSVREATFGDSVMLRCRAGGRFVLHRVESGYAYHIGSFERPGHALAALDQSCGPVHAAGPK